MTRRFYFHGPLVDVAAELVAPNLQGAASVLSFKMRGNTKTYGWHQDNGYGELSPDTALSVLMALDDVDEENGCLWMLPGSHKAGIIEAGRANLANKMSLSDNDLTMDEAAAVPIHMKAGDCIFVHGYTVHKSNGNFSDRDRRLLFVRYAEADSVEIYNDRKPRLGKLLRGQAKNPELTRYEHDLD